MFETKQQLYDIYMDNSDLRIHNKRLKEMFKPTKGDRDRLAQLHAYLRSVCQSVFHTAHSVTLNGVGSTVNRRLGRLWVTISKIVKLEDENSSLNCVAYNSFKSLLTVSAHFVLAHQRRQWKVRERFTSWAERFLAIWGMYWGMERWTHHNRNQWSALVPVCCRTELL